MKALKWILIVGGSVLALVIGALLLIPLFVDVEQYKPEIEKQVASAVGRPFAIKGPLKLSLFPWAGVSLSDLHLGSPPGYQEKDFLVVKAFDVRLKLLPLLSKDLQVQRFVIDGPRMVLERNKAGRGNWEVWGTQEKGAPKSGAPPVSQGPAAGLPLKSLAVGEFAVRNGALLYIDQASGARREMSDLTLELKDISLDRPIRLLLSAVADTMPVSVEGQVGPVGPEPGKGKIPLDVSVKAFKEVSVHLKGHLQDALAAPQFDLALAVDPFSPRKVLAALKTPFPLATADADALSRVGLKSKIQGSTQQVRLVDGVLDLDESKLTFSASAKDFAKPAVAFDLNLDKINLDRYLPPPSEKGTTEAKKDQPAAAKKTDYLPLRTLVLDGKARVGNLTAKGMKIQDINLTVTGRNGVIQVDPLLASLYKGSLSAKAALDVRQDAPRSNLTLQAKGVQAGPLLQDYLKKDFLEGTANVEAALSMVGDVPERIKRSLNGKGQAVFSNGAIKGIDLAGMIRNVTASFGLTQQGAEKPRTDFSELNAPFTITDGVVHTPGTSLASPLVRVLATGKANLVDESLDLRVEPKVVATLKGQGDAKERGGVTVPVLVRGTFSAPTFQPDVRGMLEKGLKDGTLPGAKDLLKAPPGIPKTTDDAIKGIFKGLTGK